MLPGSLVVNIGDILNLCNIETCIYEDHKLNNHEDWHIFINTLASDPYYREVVGFDLADIKYYKQNDEETLDYIWQSILYPYMIKNIDIIVSSGLDPIRPTAIQTIKELINNEN